MTETGENDDRLKYGNGKSTSHGYILEWRLKPESAAIADALPRYGPGKCGVKWSRGPYELSKLGRLGPDADKLICPCIEEHIFGQTTENGLIAKNVAEAVLACLKTVIPGRLLPHIEWRMVLIRLNTSYEMTRIEEDDDDGNKRADEQSKIHDMLTDA